MRVAIIGAGFAGLSAANELSKLGYSVTVYESAPQAGGLASGFKDEKWDWPLERFYHHIFSTDKAIQELAKEIGSAEKLLFYNQTTAQWWEGNCYPIQGGSLQLKLPFSDRALPSPDLLSTLLSVLNFPMLPFHDRVRMGIVSAYLKYLVKDWKYLESVTADEWTRRWMGENVHSQFVRPLLEGKFGVYSNDVNMSWLWARIKARSLRLGYFTGGFQRFSNDLVDHLHKLGVSIFFNTEISNIERSNGKWLIYSSRGEIGGFDVVIATGSPRILKKIVNQLPTIYLDGLSELKYIGAIVMVIALKNPLTHNMYWINLPKSEFPFLALVEHTNLISSKYYGGDNLIYCGDYLDTSHEYFRLEKDDLLERFLPALKKVNHNFDSSWVRKVWLNKEMYAQPVVPVNHSLNIPSFKTPLDGLYWISMSQVYPWDRGTNFAVELGRKVVVSILNDFKLP